jgi:site-specific recombinase XerC
VTVTPRGRVGGWLTGVFRSAHRARFRDERSPTAPPTVEEIIAVMHAAGDDHDAVRSRGLTVVLWRAGLRISAALALTKATSTFITARS